VNSANLLLSTPIFTVSAYSETYQSYTNTCQARPTRHSFQHVPGLFVLSEISEAPGDHLTLTQGLRKNKQKSEAKK